MCRTHQKQCTRSLFYMRLKLAASVQAAAFYIVPVSCMAFNGRFMASCSGRFSEQHDSISVLIFYGCVDSAWCLVLGYVG
jgi:hypothetical protein